MTEQNNQDNENSNENSKENYKEEKRKRKFDLRLIIIIIIGLSIVFGILIFRKVKQAIQNPPVYSESGAAPALKQRGLNREQRQKHFEKRREQVNQAAKREKLALKGRPLRPRQQRDIPHFIDEGQVKLSKLPDGVNSRYREVENIVSMSSSFKDQFDEADIIDEKMNRIFVERDRASGMEFDKVSFNQRTKQLGVITGKLLLRFVDRDGFEKRSDLYPKDAEEERVFEATHLAIIAVGDRSLSELLEIEKSLSQRQQLKHVKIEILENGKVPR